MERKKLLVYVDLLLVVFVRNLLVCSLICRRGFKNVSIKISSMKCVENCGIIDSKVGYMKTIL